MFIDALSASSSIIRSGRFILFEISTAGDPSKKEISLYSKEIVKLDEKRVDDIQATIQPDGEQILKVGKRRFLKVHG